MTATFVATAGLEAAPLHDGAVLYNLKTGRFIMLNRSASLLWNELSTPRTAEDLASALAAAHAGLSAQAAGEDVAQLTKVMAELEIVRAGEGAGTAIGALANGQAYEAPVARVLDEDELLKVFQMTAAEISVASCWWGACATGCAA